MCSPVLPRRQPAGAGDSHSWIDAEGVENLHGFDHTWEPVACATCHFATVTEPGVRGREPDPFDEGWSVYEDVPIAGFVHHANGAADVAFTSDPVTMKPTSPPFDRSPSTWDADTRMCSSVACHLEQVVVEWGSPYRWQNVYECDSCHRYSSR